MNITNRIHNSYLMTKLARQLVGRDLAQAQAREKNAPAPKAEPRIINPYGKTKIERGESPREALIWDTPEQRKSVGWANMDKELEMMAQPVPRRNPLGANPAARGDAPRIASTPRITSNNMIDILQKSREPDPRYLQRMAQQGKDPVVPSNADYAVNPALGNTGAPARAIPVGPTAPTPAPRPQVSEADLQAQFKRNHRTSFDKDSPVDRRKMDALRKKLMGG
jgi:hypothetical protein